MLAGIFDRVGPEIVHNIAERIVGNRRDIARTVVVPLPPVGQNAVQIAARKFKDVFDQCANDRIGHNFLEHIGIVANDRSSHIRRQQRAQTFAKGRTRQLIGHFHRFTGFRIARVLQLHQAAMFVGERLVALKVGFAILGDDLVVGLAHNIAARVLVDRHGKVQITVAVAVGNTFDICQLVIGQMGQHRCVVNPKPVRDIRVRSGHLKVVNLMRARAGDLRQINRFACDQVIWQFRLQQIQARKYGGSGG